MAEVVRFDPTAGAARRTAIGALVSSDCRRLAAALVTVAGQGLATKVEVGEGITAQVSRETTGLFARLVDPGATSAGPEAIEALAALRCQLADHVASLVDALLAQAQAPPGKALAIGVHDPGLWSRGGATAAAYVPTCDPARLAESTGLNVVDAFPGRDLARGGQGGPLFALPEWLCLRSPHRSRLLLDLGRTTRMTWLPRGAPATGLPYVLSFDVGPGCGLLDLLVERLTNREHAFDPGGRFAVQGRCIPELLERWLSDPYFRRSLPRWSPRGARPERFVVEAMHLAVERGWTVRDVLCTATHFAAEAVAVALRQRLPQDAAVDEIVLTGGGQQNGMLLREIAARTPGTPVVRINDLGIAWESFGPACVALLTLLHIDQTPSNLPEVTGAEMSRPLGRLTPGSPQGWQRLLAEMAGSRPALRPLRSAL